MTERARSFCPTCPRGSATANWRRTLAVAWLSLVAVAGCSRVPDVDATYGKRRGYPASASVNGTSVLAGMFEAAGARVVSTSRLSKTVRASQVVVWAPDRFLLPSSEVYAFFDEWLGAERGRTLVYIARDYDASIDYWRAMVETGPMLGLEEYQRRLATAEYDFDTRRRGGASGAITFSPLVAGEVPAKQEGDWFSVHREDSPRKVGTLMGPWSTGVDASKTDVTTYSQLVPLEVDENEYHWQREFNTEVLLAEEEGARPLVLRITNPYWGSEGQVLVVANGSWLLNYPLVNREHRKLAARLIADCDPSGERVTFLETGDRGAQVASDTDDSFWRLLKQQPIGTVLMHLTVLGIVYCCAAFPIFGRPRTLTQDALSDFGKHVVAYGRQLAKSRDAEYARTRIRIYQQVVRREGTGNPFESKGHAIHVESTEGPQAPTDAAVDGRDAGPGDTPGTPEIPSTKDNARKG